MSVCRSVRITPAAHEAGVETLPEFRGKGYAQDVVAGKGTCRPVFRRYTLIQYLLGEYCLASSGEKIAPGPGLRFADFQVT